MLYIASYARDHIDDIKKNSCFVIGKQTVELIVPEMLIVLKKTLFFMKYQWSGILHKEI